MNYIKGKFKSELEEDVEYFLLETEDHELILITEELQYIEVNKFKNPGEFIEAFYKYKDNSECLEDYTQELNDEIERLEGIIKEQEILLESLED